MHTEKSSAPVYLRGWNGRVSERRGARRATEWGGGGGVAGRRARARRVAGARRHDEGALRLELHHEGDVVRVVLRVDVRLLQGDADDRRVVGVDAERGGVLVLEPVHVLDGGLEDPRRHRVPDPLVGDHVGLLHLEGGERGSGGERAWWVAWGAGHRGGRARPRALVPAGEGAARTSSSPRRLPSEISPT